ncbi:MAG TPA: ATP-binding protein [Prolixibacteraceae bacterium]|nr:ATP-binding protein [Prolixibacteraceae bacterium]
MERTLIISSRLKNIEQVREFVKEIFREARLNMSFFNRIFLGISEAVSNAILHGNKMNPEKNVLIKMKLRGNRFNIEVEDEGKGFSEHDVFDPTCKEHIKREHGRGIFILRNLADEISFKDDGRKILIQFTIPE